jgi:hypothetical protein
MPIPIENNKNTVCKYLKSEEEMGSQIPSLLDKCS